MIAYFVVVALVGAGHVSGGNNEGDSCKFTLQTDLDPKKEPLVLAVKKTEIRGDGGTGGLEDIEVEQLEIARPEVVDGKGVISVSSGKQLLFACTGKKNYNPVTKDQTAYAICADGQLTIEGRPVSVQTDSCTKSFADSWLRKTGAKCGSPDFGAEVFDLGFKLDDGSFFPLVEVCHDTKTTTTLYSSHAVYGSSLQGGVKSSIRRKFSRGPSFLYSNVNPDHAYKRTSQEEAFKKVLGTFSPYINSTCFLARGHLAPDADFIYNSGQLLTYYYINAEPQWQPFNAGNWLGIENTVRYLAYKENQTLNVYTGTFGTLTLKDKQLYLAPDKKLMSVPEVFWKLVQHPVTKSCTVAVGVNNVFLTEAPTKTICDPVTPAGWPTLQDLTKGYVYYCDYHSFNETVKYLPHLECKDLFEYE